MAERMEVVHPQPAGDLQPEQPLQPIRQLCRGLDVVGQQEHVLWLEGLVAREQMADALDHHRRLARAGAGQDHQRTVAPLDGGALLVCQLDQCLPRRRRLCPRCHQPQYMQWYACSCPLRRVPWVASERASPRLTKRALVRQDRSILGS
jgi:hypothetical protein